MTPDSKDGVSLTMRDLGRDYVQFTNRKYNRSGSMWEGRFRSSLVDTDSYCLACYRYIEMNPVRAHMVEKPEAYPWSSFRHNALGGKNNLIMPHSSWIALGNSFRQRTKAYRCMFDCDLDSKSVAEIRYGIAKGLPTGSAAFKSKIEKILSIDLRSGLVGRPKKQNL